ncbi:hypothetical protein [Streptomyces sp. NPDC058307]|uniref:hypothetical protein n=1 Tax=Streptomyces sp. NPDC058307 TaxID=3346439 RepID=UPI0036E72705
MPETLSAIAPLTFMSAIISAVILAAIAHPNPSVRSRAYRVLEIIFTRHGSN